MAPAGIGDSLEGIHAVAAALAPFEARAGQGWPAVTRVMRLGVRLRLAFAVERKRGSGTFVSARRVPRALGSPLSFSESTRLRGMVPSSRVLRAGPVEISAEVAAVFGIKASTPAIVLGVSMVPASNVVELGRQVHDLVRRGSPLDLRQRLGRDAEAVERVAIAVDRAAADHHRPAIHDNHLVVHAAVEALEVVDRVQTIPELLAGACMFMQITNTIEPIVNPAAVLQGLEQVLFQQSGPHRCAGLVQHRKQRARQTSADDRDFPGAFQALTHSLCSHTG